MARLRLSRWLLILGAITLALGGAILLLGPSQPAVLPPSAAPLALRTQAWRLWPPVVFGCGQAEVTPIRVERNGLAMVFADTSTGDRVRAIWPNGYSAWLLNGRAELVRPDGSVFAREGDVVSGLAGGAADNGDILICIDFASHPVVELSP